MQGRKESWPQANGNSVEYIAQHDPFSEAILYDLSEHSMSDWMDTFCLAASAYRRYISLGFGDMDIYC